MKMRFVLCLAGLLALPALSSCVRQSDLDNLTARVNQNEQQVRGLSSKVGNVEQVLPGQADMWAQMQAMRQELNTVRGQLDEMNAKGAADAASEMGRLRDTTNRLEVALRQMASELGMQIEALNAPADAGGYSGMHPTPPGGVPSTSSTISATTGAVPQPGASGASGATAVDTATALYDAGMQAFGSRRYRDAVKAFGDFGKSFPQHKLASNAHFWLGESYYQLKDYAGAALAYQQVIEKFPGSSKFQSAMLKQGMAFYAAGTKDAARLRLEELIKKYPSSPEAGRAKKFLQENKK